MLLVMAI